MPHGGRRPGAGAPRGNLNAFKTGRHSQQFKLALAALLTNEETGSLLRAILEKQRRDRLYFQALVITSAKLVMNTQLKDAVRRKLEDFANKSQHNPYNTQSPGKNT
jgi:pantothenate kinase type III